MKKLGWLFTILGGIGNIAARIIKDTEWYLDDKIYYNWNGDGGWIFKSVNWSVYLFTALLVLGILFVVLSYIKHYGGKINTANVAGDIKGKVQNVVKTGAIAIGKIAFCDVCGKEIAPNDTFCRHCSSKITKAVMPIQQHTSVCQSCDNPISDEAVFCEKCGKEIIRHTYKEPFVVSIPEEETQKAFCYSCGNTLSKESSFCNKCGAKI